MVSFSCDTRPQHTSQQEILQAAFVPKVTETASVNFFSRKGGLNGMKTALTFLPVVHCRAEIGITPQHDAPALPAISSSTEIQFRCT
jgi:hypothetical protein